MGAQLFKEKSLLDEAHTRYLHPASSSSELSLLKLRNDTPGTEHVVHFNNAGASLPPTPVLLAVEQYLKAEATIGGYEAVDRYVAALERPYSLIASLINCQPSEVAVVTSATVAWQQVVYGLAWLWKPGDRLLTSVAEYGSNYIAYLQLKKRTGVQIEVIPETAGGDLDLPAAERMILDGAKPVLISVTYIPTSSGKVYDAEGLGKLAKRHGILYMLDACQAVGQVPVDVQRLGCDFLSATGRKFLRAPRGSGFLYASRDVMDRFEPAVLDNVGARWVAKDTYQLEPTAKRFECYEMSFAAKVGLGVAVDYCLQLGVADTIWPRVQKLAHILRAGLMALPGVRVWDQGRILCGIVSFTKAGMPADSIQQRLAANKINVAVSRAGSSRLDFESRGIQEVVRVSVHYYNTEREVQQLLDAVEQL